MKIFALSGDPQGGLNYNRLFGVRHLRFPGRAYNAFLYSGFSAVQSAEQPKIE
jgi:hypothetical protein